MEKFSITIATDFSDKPGGRWKNLGPNSGEEFYETVLLPKFDAAIEANERLYIYLDGAKSYPNSFLDQSFGELGRMRDLSLVQRTLVFKTTAFQWAVKYIEEEIWGKR